MKKNLNDNTPSAGGNIKIGIVTLENSLAISFKTENGLVLFSIFILGYLSQRNKNI